MFVLLMLTHYTANTHAAFFCFQHHYATEEAHADLVEVFTSRRYASEVYAVAVCLSVRLSVGHKPAL